MNWEELVQNVAFPILCVIGLAWFIYYIANRWMNESNKREESQRAESKEREDKLIEVCNKLIEANKEFSQSLQEVAGTLAEANEQNRILSENNKLFTEQLDDMNEGINKIINKLEIIQSNT